MSPGAVRLSCPLERGSKFLDALRHPCHARAFQPALAPGRSALRNRTHPSGDVWITSAARLARLLVPEAVRGKGPRGSFHDPLYDPRDAAPETSGSDMTTPTGG